MLLKIRGKKVYRLKAPSQQIAKIQTNASFVIDYQSFLPFSQRFTITMAFLPQPTALKEWKRLLLLPALSYSVRLLHNFLTCQKKPQTKKLGEEEKESPLLKLFRGV